MSLSSPRPPFRLRVPAIAASIALLVSGVSLTTGAAAFAEDGSSTPQTVQQEGGTAETGPETSGSGSEGDEADGAPTGSAEEGAAGDGTTAQGDASGENAPDEAASTNEAGTAEDPDPARPASDEPALESASPAYDALITGATTRNEAEPNDDRAKANSLPIGDTMRGTMKDRWEEDFYRITPSQDGRIKINFTFPTSVSGDAYGLEVLDSKGSRYYYFDLNGADAGGSRIAGTATFVPAGTAYIRISANYHDAVVGKQYSLRVDHTAGYVETEFNDDRATADPLAFGKTILGTSGDRWDEDFFVLNSSRSGSGTLNFTFPSSVSGDAYEVQLLDANGNQIHDFDLNSSHANGQKLQQLSLPFPAGQFFIRVSPNYHDAVVGKEYRLTFGQRLSPATPTISGALKPGSTLTAKPGTWGPAPVSLAYQWNRDGKAVAGATKSTYVLTAEDVGRSITVTVTGSKSGYTSASRTSAKKAIPTTFIDVPRNHKFYSEIQWMYDSGATTGIKTSRGLAYQPKADVTREAMAAFLYRQKAPGSYRPTGQHFADVPKNHKFYRQIEWMYDSGLSTGSMKNGKRVYNPKAGVSREAMAAFLYRLQGPENGAAPSTAPFVDVPQNHKFAKEIAWMRTTGLSTGNSTPSGKAYLPKDTVSREAMAAFLYRASRLRG
ncbi:MAG: S-layer homology domain-containing protein [Leucobacter sp.]